MVGGEHAGKRPGTPKVRPFSLSSLGKICLRICFEMGGRARYLFEPRQKKQEGVAAGVPVVLCGAQGGQAALSLADRARGWRFPTSRGGFWSIVLPVEKVNMRPRPAPAFTRGRR